ncbi:restriction endonuclease subunit S, partial [Chromobacterium piscinae]
IATALSDVDALITGLEQLIAKKRDLKQAAMQQLLTGQTRLPGFSGAWEVKRLGDVADVIDPHPSHRAPDEVANGVPFVGIGDLDEGGSIVGKKVRLVSAMVLEEHATRYDLNDELIGLGRVASIGKVVALRKHTDGYAISPTLGVIRGREAKRSYLLYALKSKFVTEQFAKIMSGSTRSSVGMEVLRLLQILLPPNEQEQTAIAAVLSDMDAELAALEARLAKSRAIKQGMMQELLTGRTRLV